ncbi:rRNA maturation RNase YbeY [Nonlabens antarcticus]|uniref:rRNA maturation RNase YbeY n=1 Tax=Nonlabens antarcticus TaxID=392714 RepID=UPI001891D0EF|nr:rRNA maturation RNase YbeY [Nonlabens antarcticus]
MIDFSSQTDFDLTEVRKHGDWLTSVADSYDAMIESLGYVFCDDEYLHSLNVQHLDHDTLTDIITFDYGTEDVLEGELYISIDRVRENAVEFGQEFEEELRRVMVHGILHMLGFGDHTKEDKHKMRLLEDENIKLFHVKQ